MTASQSCVVATQPFGILCGEPGAAYQRATCACEPPHVREGWLCQGHRDSGERQCRICAHLDGGQAHSCPVTVAEAVPA
jgi:hypothetical protein